MQDAVHIPTDLPGCQATIRDLLATVDQQREELAKCRKLIQELVSGKRNEKRHFSGAEQQLLPFENEVEYQAAREEAEAEAQSIIETIEVKRKVRKRKRRNESFPAHLPRIEKIVEASADLKHCEEHGERKLVGFDRTETLVYPREPLRVVVKLYPKYACEKHPACGIQSPERPTSLVEGDRYDTSVASTIIEAKWFHYQPIYRHQDQFASLGWTPSRSTLLNIVHSVEFVADPLVAFLTQRVQNDVGVGLDDTSCRLLIPKFPPLVKPGDTKAQRLADKIAEARAKNEDSIIAKMWVYSGLVNAPYNIFDFRVSRHRDGPDEFFRNSRCKVQGDCFSGNKSVIVKSDGRLEFVACWTHARRKVVEVETYKSDAETLVRMIQVLYDIEERGKELTWQERQALRQRESTVVLRGIRKWLDSPPISARLPKSDFAEALRYIDNHWEALTRYTTDGRIPIDNNSVEHLMKQVALGRKAWLFVGSVAAGEQSAKMMTLVSSAKRHDLDVWVYIKDVLDQLLAGSTDYASLHPDVWKKTHPEAIRVYRADERQDKAERKQLRAAQRRTAAK